MTQLIQEDITNVSNNEIPISKQFISLISTLTLMAFSFFTTWNRDFAHISYNILLVFWILGGYYKKTFKLIINYKPFIFLTLFTLFLACGILWSNAPRYGKEVFHRYSYFLLTLIILPMINEKNYRLVAWALLSSVLLIFINANCIRFGIIYQENPSYNPTSWTNYHDLSFLLGVLIILLLHCFTSMLEKKRYIAVVITFISIGFIFYQQVYVNARMNLIGTIFSVFIFLLLKYPHLLKKIFIPIVILTSLLGVIAWNISSTVEQRFTSVYEEYKTLKKDKYQSALGCRIAYYDVGISLIKKNPLVGMGTGEHKKEFDRYVQTYKDGIYKEIPKWLKTYHYHSDYIEIAVQIGVIGLILYLFGMYFFISSWRQSPFFPLGTTILSFFGISGLTDVMFIHRNIIFSLTVFISLITYSVYRNPTKHFEKAHLKDMKEKNEKRPI